MCNCCSDIRKTCRFFCHRGCPKLTRCQWQEIWLTPPYSALQFPYRDPGNAFFYARRLLLNFLLWPFIASFFFQLGDILSCARFQPEARSQCRLPSGSYQRPTVDSEALGLWRKNCPSSIYGTTQKSHWDGEQNWKRQGLWQLWRMSRSNRGYTFIHRLIDCGYKRSESARSPTLISLLLLHFYSRWGRHRLWSYFTRQTQQNNYTQGWPYYLENAQCRMLLFGLSWREILAKFATVSELFRAL